MAGLLSTKRQRPVHHLFHHVLVANRTAHETDAELPQCDLETDVAHHRRDDGIALQSAFTLQLAAAHQQDSVAVDDATAMVHENRAIAVAVERDAHLATVLDDSTRERLGMSRPGVEVDVASVRLVADEEGVETEAAEQFRRHRRRRAVRAVDDQREPLERRCFGKHGTQVIQIRADKIGLRDPWRVTPLRAPRQIGDDGLDLTLHPFGELLAAPGKHLDAVVLERVVRGGDHDAGVVAG